MPKQKTTAEKQAIRKQGREDLKSGLKEVAKAVAKGAASKVVTGKAGATNVAHAVRGGIQAIKGAAKALFNDLAWFTHYDEATKEMIGLNFNVIQGSINSVENPAQDNYTHPTGYATAGIIVHPSLGDNSDHAISTGYNRLFTAIRQANSGAVNWSKSDLQVYITNIRAVIIAYTIGTRALRELNRQSILVSKNPVLNFAAMGLDYYTFADNAANLRNLLINAKVRLASFAAPRLPLFERTQWMFRGCFWDSNDAKHQTYYFRPYSMPNFEIDDGDYFYQVNSITTASPTSTTTGMTYSTYVSQFLNMTIDYLLAQPASSIISGDIAKAYGIDKLFFLDPVPGENDTPIEGYNEESLTEIQNAWNPVTSEFPYDSSVGYVTQGPDDIWGDNLVLGTQHRPTTSDYQRARNSSVVNMYKDKISNADVLMATRLQCLYDNSTYTARGTGSEVYISTHFYAFDDVASVSTRDKIREVIITSIEELSLPFNSIHTEVVSWNEITAHSRFNYVPRMLPYIGGFPSGSTTVVYRMVSDIFDYNNYAFIRNFNTLQDISHIANQSLIFTPLLLRASNNVVEY